MGKLRQAYLKIRYWRQIRKGYGLLETHGTKRHFLIANGKAFVMNGVDPLVKVDLKNGVAQAYKPPKDKAKFSIYYNVTPTNEESKDG